MLLVGIELVKFLRDVKLRETPIIALTTALSLLANMAMGYMVALGAYHALRRWGRGNKYFRWIVE